MIANLIYLSDSDNAIDKYSEEARTFLEKLGPESVHHWNEARSIDLLFKIDPRYVLCYEKLIPYAYKSDMAKYAILYYHGGIVADLGISLLSNKSKFAHYSTLFFKDVVFNHYDKKICYGIQNAFMYSKPGNEIFLHALDSICDNIESEYYGDNPWSITGPQLINKVVDLYNYPIIGSCKYTKGDASLFSYYLGNNRIAMYKKTSKIKNKPYTPENDYVMAWYNKMVYKK